MKRRDMLSNVLGRTVESRPRETARRTLQKRDFCLEMRDDVHAILTAVRAGDLHHAEVLGEILIDQIDNVLAEG